MATEKTILARPPRTTPKSDKHATNDVAKVNGIKSEVSNSDPSNDSPTGKSTRKSSRRKQQPRYHHNQQYMPNGAAGHQITPAPGATPLLPNQGRVIQSGSTRVLCIADVRGNLRSLNTLAKEARADYIIHTGDFGFYDESSLERIAEKTLKHVAQYSPLISEPVKKQIQQAGNNQVKNRFSPSELLLSELPMFMGRDALKLDVPVYTVWGACEDVRVLEKFRSNEYKVPNLHIVDEARSMLLEVAGVKLRLLGLGGAVVMHKLFDNGEGRTTIAGGQGTMWTTLLQMGELIDTANRVYDPTETRVFITHASPAREGILNQLSVALKADFSISAGLHFRYGSSYNEFSVNPTLDHFRGKLAASKASFNDVWETVKSEVEPAIAQNEAQQTLLRNALSLVEKMPTTAAGGNPFGNNTGAPPVGTVDESAFKNMWNFNLADAAFGWLVLDIQDGRIGTEMRAQGFNFSHRGAKQQPQAQNAPAAPATSTAPLASAAMPTQPPTNPAAQRQQVNVPPKSSPAPQAAHSNAAAPKPSTPAPRSTTPGKEQDKSAALNGSAHGPEGTSPGSTRPDTIGLFVMNSTSDDQVRDLFAAEDKAKITKLEKYGQANRVVHFATAADRDGALERLPAENKGGSGGDRTKPLFRVFSPKSRDNFGGGRGGAGQWTSGRGAAAQGQGRSGYQSAGGASAGAGTASDSEGGNRRGRGGARGGRGEGGRGRGGERGGRGGRGGAKGAADGANGNSPAATTPAAAPAPAAAASTSTPAQGET